MLRISAVLSVERSLPVCLSVRPSNTAQCIVFQHLKAPMFSFSVTNRRYEMVTGSPPTGVLNTRGVGLEKFEHLLSYSPGLTKV